MLTVLRQGDVPPPGGGQGYVLYHTLVGHIVFRIVLQPQRASDIKCVVFILNGRIGGDALRNLQILGILAPFIPRYVNGLWEEPTCLTPKTLVIIIFRLGFLHKYADWESCRGRRVIL